MSLVPSAEKDSLRLRVEYDSAHSPISFENSPTRFSIHRYSACINTNFYIKKAAHILFEFAFGGIIVKVFHASPFLLKDAKAKDNRHFILCGKARKLV